MASAWWQRLVNGKTHNSHRACARTAKKRPAIPSLSLEQLEGRTLLSASSLTTLAPAPTGNPATAQTAATALAATHTGWAIVPTPTVYGQAAMFTAQVTSGAGHPSGQVVFKDGTTVLGTAALDGTGKATFSISSLGVGTHEITAGFVANGHYGASTSSAEPLQVSPAHDTVSLQSSPPPSTVLANGQQVTLTASVIGLTPGAGSPSGKVQFLDNGKALGQPVALNGSGNAILATSLAGPASHTITARYQGDGHFQGGTSASLTLQVSAVHKSPSVTDLVSQTTTLTVGQTLPVTVQVLGSGQGTAQPAVASPASPKPAGQVQFTIDGNAIGGPVALNSTGKVTISFQGLLAGNHLLTATYLGDGHYAASSQTVTIQVNAAHRSASTTTLTASTTNPGAGKPITLTAKVATSSGGANPTGKVQFLVDGKAQGQPVALNLSGEATATFSLTQPGSHKISAEYQGDGFYTSSTSKALNVQVGVPPKATPGMTLTASATSATLGKAVTFTVQISPSSGGAKPTGKVQLLVNGKAQGQPVTLSSSGKAVFTLTLSQTGSFKVSAEYLGDAAYTTDTSKTVTVQITGVSKSSTVTKLTVSAATAAFGKSVTLTAQVAPSTSGSGKPTGMVQFWANGKALGKAVAVGADGKAVLAVTNLAADPYQVTARYLGDAHFSASSSKAVALEITKASVTVALKSSTTPLTPGQKVTLKAQVTAHLTGDARLTGMVLFLDNGVALGKPVEVDETGEATLAVPLFKPGAHDIVAKFLGNGNFLAASSPALVQQVKSFK